MSPKHDTPDVVEMYELLREQQRKIEVLEARLGVAAQREPEVAGPRGRPNAPAPARGHRLTRASLLKGAAMGTAASVGAAALLTLDGPPGEPLEGGVPVAEATGSEGQTSFSMTNANNPNDNVTVAYSTPLVLDSNGNGNSSQTYALTGSGSTQKLAIRIQIPANTQYLGDILVQLQTTGTFPFGAAIAAALYTDSSGVPGTSLANTQNDVYTQLVTDNQGSGFYASYFGFQYTFNPVPSSATYFWIVFTLTNTGGTVYFQQSSNTAGSDYEVATNNGSTWSVTSGSSAVVTANGATPMGAQGSSENNHGVRGVSTTSNGVYGSSTFDHGVLGTGTQAVGVVGTSTYDNGVYGQSTNSFGVYGKSTSSSAVVGLVVGSVLPTNAQTGKYGVLGVSTTAGVVGVTSGLTGPSSGAYGVFGDGGPSGYGGYFQGGVAPLHLTPATTSGPPTSNYHTKGDLWVDSGGVLYICTAAGTPGTWQTVGSQT
jgi:hypothetical protein